MSKQIQNKNAREQALANAMRASGGRLDMDALPPGLADDANAVAEDLEINGELEVLESEDFASSSDWHRADGRRYKVLARVGEHLRLLIDLRGAKPHKALEALGGKP